MYYAIKIALRDLGVEGVFPTDIGCYTLGLLPPLSMADYLICMGSSITTACGLSRASGQKVVAFIGDSTFFHGGSPGWPTRCTTATTSCWSSWTTAPPP